MLTLLASIAFASDLDVSLQGFMAAGQTIEITVTGMEPGEEVFVVYSQDLGTSCPGRVAPSCLDIVAPTLVRRGIPATTSATFRWVLPGPAVGATLQAVSRGSVSAPVLLSSEVIVDTGGDDPFLEFMSVDRSCNADEATLLLEYMGVADGVRAHAYRSGALVESFDLVIDESISDDLIGLTTMATLPIVDCSSVTWVYEAWSADIEACLVDGDEADDLVGGEYGSCYVW